eukprot:g8724.t1
MGLDWSAPPGRAEVPPILLPFTVWGKDDLSMLRRRHAVSLGGKYALHVRHFAKLLGADSCTSEQIFQAIFDTDANGLVDAFEAMCALALLCSATLAEKVDFMHSLFDFGLDGDLSLPEVTILVRTALIACAKARLDYESSLPKHLFESFVFRDAQMTAFLQLWSGSITQVVVPEGSLWEDPDFPPDQRHERAPHSLSLVAGVVPPGMPPARAVRWLRPTEVSGGDGAVLFVGDVPGSSPIVAGQLADQWLLSAIGILTGHPHLLRSLFLPTRQEAVGRYCVRLFKEANWINIFVDNLIACNASGDALFCRGQEGHELWSSLLEKAFAKAHGCYENLMHGDTRDALRDLTGGVADKLQWQLAAPESTAMSPQQAAPERLPGIPPAGAGVGAGAGAGAGGVPATVGATGTGLLRPRVAGWGVSPGTTPPLGWVFEEMRDRLLEGQVLGCSRQAWVRCPWGGDGDGQKSADDESLFPPSNRLMRGLCSGVSYCVMEAFERGDVRLVRLRDPWAARQPGTEPGEYLGGWGPSSSQWSARPALASELLPRTLRGMFWMEIDAFLEVFNTLYAVDLTGGAAAAGQEAAKRASPSSSKASASSSLHAGAGSKEGYCQGSWEGEGCGGRFTGGKGWLQGTQAFLQIGPGDRSGSAASIGTGGGTGGDSAAVPSVAPSFAATKGHSSDVKDHAQVVITVTQEDSRYHRSDYAERRERRHSIGFLVHSHRWSADSKRDIPKLSKILQKETKHLTRPFVPRRDVSCRLALPAGQYAIVATTLEVGSAGRFWVHVKADREFTLQPSVPGAAVPGSNAGDCDMKAREAGQAVGAAYNEVEEDAEGNGMTADAASLGKLLASAQALAAENAAIEHSRELLRVRRRQQQEEREGEPPEEQGEQEDPTDEEQGREEQDS